MSKDNDDQSSGCFLFMTVCVLVFSMFSHESRIEKLERKVKEREEYWDNFWSTLTNHYATNIVIQQDSIGPAELKFKK